MKFKNIVFTLIYLLVPFLIFAQKNEETKSSSIPFSLGVRLHYGFVIQHSQSVASVRGAYPKALELDFNWQNDDELSWIRSKSYPSFGLFLKFIDFGKPEVLGYAAASGIYFEYYFNFPAAFNPFIRGGVGASYLTNPYDPVDNSDNMSYAMALNFHLFVNLGFKWQFNDRWYSNFSINMNHDSNAGIKEPNGGVNYPTVSIGAGYVFNPGKYIDRGDVPFEKVDDRWDLSFYWGLSAVNFPDKGQFPMMGIDIIRSKRLTRIGAVLYGAEFEFNGRGNWKNHTYHHDKFNPYRVSVRGGWEFYMGKTRFSIALGAYVYRPIVESDFIYQRYGVIYFITDNISAGINFKAYRHTADFVDFRIGWSFF